MKETIITEQNIKKLVHQFYKKVRADKNLGLVFQNAIGINDQDFELHLERILGFWSSIMLNTGKYHGNTMKKHKDLPTFDIELFDQWLNLFIKTVYEIYDDEIAKIYIEKSKRIAESLKLGLYYKPY